MVIPKTFERFAEIKVSELKDALRRISLMIEDQHRRVEFVFTQNKLLLKSESAETGNSAEEIGCTFQRSSNSENNLPESFDG